MSNPFESHRESDELSAERVSLSPSESDDSASVNALIGGSSDEVMIAPVDRPVRLTPSDPPGLHRVVTPGQLLIALRKCWRTAVPVGLLLGVSLAIAAWFLRPDKSTSFALIRVAPTQEQILKDSNRPIGRDGDYLRTQLAVMKSRPVLREAVAEEKIRQLPIFAGGVDPVEWLEKQLQIEQIAGTEIVRLSLTSRIQGSDYAPVLNAVVAAYLATVVKTEHAQQLVRLNELQRVYTDSQEKVRQQQQSLQSLTRDLRGGNAAVIELKQKALIDEYSTLKRELALINAKRRELEVKTDSYKLRLKPEAAKAALDDGPSEAGLQAALAEQEVQTDPAVLAKVTEVARLKGNLEQLRSVITASGAPAIIQEAKTKIATAEAELVNLRAARRKIVEARLRNSTIANLELSLRSSELELATLGKQHEAVQTEVDSLKKQVDDLGLGSVDLELRRAENDRSEAFLRNIWDQKERLEIELKAAGLERVSLLAKAEPAAILNKLGRLQEAAAAGFAGLLVGLFLVSLREFRRGRVVSVKDVTHGLHLPVLGTLPTLPDQDAAQILASPDMGTIEALAMIDSIDTVRTAILGRHSGDRCMVLLIASPAAFEGKTMLAVQLAASLARSGRKTLLMDGDLRSPSIGKLFDAETLPGVCELFAGELNVPMRPGPVAGLWYLPAGNITSGAVKGLANWAARVLFAKLRRRFEFIVVDSSPLLLVPDALMLGREVDGVIFSVRPGVSQVAEVHAAYERAREHRLPFTGVVVNGVAAQSAYGYGQYRSGAAVRA